MLFKLLATTVDCGCVLLEFLSANVSRRRDGYLTNGEAVIRDMSWSEATFEHVPQSFQQGHKPTSQVSREHQIPQTSLVHGQMSRFGGLSEERPSVIKTRSKLGTHLSTQCSGDERQSRPCAAR
ncbi:hypothetical protein TNCV_674741 [Trichonephila clavipes]|nr:hypothetical protein TNCV_674741 [Trichonephila clavipes]